MVVALAASAAKLRGADLGQALAQRADDAPTAHVRAGGDSKAADGDNPKLRTGAGRLQTHGDERQRDDAHGFLGVVCTVRKSHQASGDGLTMTEAGLNLLLAHVLDHSEDELDRAEGRQTGNDRRHKAGTRILVITAAKLTPHARADDDSADQTAEQRMAARGRKAYQPGKQVPNDGADQARQDELGSDGDHLLVDQTTGDGLCDLYGQKRADQVQRARGDNSGFGLSAPVAMDVAIALAVSWKPFVKSNVNAVTITKRRLPALPDPLLSFSLRKPHCVVETSSVREAQPI